MAKILLAKGARGELVRKIQVALTDQGFDPRGTDGQFGKDTEAAVKSFQQARSLEPTAKVDALTWSALFGASIPTVQERSLQLTAAFEGHGFTLAQGNFDGAGITWGIIGFTLKHGELGKIILRIFAEKPSLVQQAFGDNADELIDILKSPKAVQMRFADAISQGTTKATIKEPWRTGFRVFGEIADVQALQLELADKDYGRPASATADRFGLKSELGRALAFDIHVQNGSIKPSAEAEILETLQDTPISTEQERRVIIANAVADASTSHKEDVRARKLTIATGTGKVHSEAFVLSNWGLDESVADA